MSTSCKYPINFSKLNSNYDFYDELPDVYENAKEYLSAFKWCEEIYHADLYYNLGSTLCILLFNIENSQSIEDNRIWVIIGDLPSMYLDVFGERTIKGVLEIYIELAEDWAENVLSNKSVEKCYPFDIEPSTELAKMLKLRTKFLQNELLPYIEDVELND